MAQRRRHRRVLILGASGTGKSHLARFFKQMGKNAIDADDYDGLSDYRDKNGRIVDYRLVPDWKPNSGLRWTWSPTVLKRLLKKKEVYLFGGAYNTRRYISLFDEVYYLHVSRKRVLLDRLKKRKHLFGKTKTQVKWVLEERKRQYNEARKHGYKVIEASLPKQKIFRIICGNGTGLR